MTLEDLAEAAEAARPRTPARIQRRRVKGWRKPSHAVIVDRTSRWGNPARIERDDTPAGAWRVVCERETIATGLTRDQAQHLAVSHYEAYLTTRPDLVAQARAELAGRDLVCPCAPGMPCHVDILISVANRG